MSFGKRNRFEERVEAFPGTEQDVPRSVKGIALIAMILGGTMILLCGWCTAGVILAPLMQGGQVTGQEVAAYSMFTVIGVGFGALGIIPGVFLVLIGRSLKRKKPHIGFGIAMTLLAIPVIGVAGMMTSIHDKTISQTGEFLAWFAVLTFLGGIWITLSAIISPHKAAIKRAGEKILPPEKRDIVGHAKTYVDETAVNNTAVRDPGLRLTAKIIFWLAAILIVLSLLGTAYLAIFEDPDIIPLILLETVVLGVLGWLAYVMELHIKRGPNLLTEITVILFGLLTLAVGGIGLLFIGWSIWSMVVRSKSKQDTSYDP